MSLKQPFVNAMSERQQINPILGFGREKRFKIDNTPFNFHPKMKIAHVEIVNVIGCHLLPDHKAFSRGFLENLCSNDTKRK
jgi:hypothetical protein